MRSGEADECSEANLLKGLDVNNIESEKMATINFHVQEIKQDIEEKPSLSRTI